MYSLPVQLSDTLQARPETLQDLYDDLALSPSGGFFPVGATGLWHGGVHLPTGGARPIYASAPGRIVAARLAEDIDAATTRYGHSNFLLTRHTWQPNSDDAGEGVPYFMLYMHLQPKPLTEVARAPGAAPWFAGAPLLRITASNGLNLRAEPDLTDASKLDGLATRQLLKPLGEPVDALGYRWREVAVVGRDPSRDDATGFVATQERPSQERPSQERPSGGGAVPGGSAERWVERAEPPIGAGVVETLRAGEIAALDLPIEAGDMLWWAGEYGLEPEAWHPDAVRAWKEAYERGDVTGDRAVPRQHAVHWEVFSAAPAFGLEATRDAGGDGAPGDSAPSAGASAVDWTAVEDSNGDLVLDPDASDALDLAEEAWRKERHLRGPSGYLDLTPNQRTYFFLDGAGTTLRRHAVKFVSEWGVRDVAAAVEASPDYRAADVAEIEQLQWWDDARAAGVDLPADPSVWHYHPVAALEALVAQEPTFVVDVDGERHEVERYEDVRDLVFDEHRVEADTIPDLESQGDAARLKSVRNALHGREVSVAEGGTDRPLAPVILQKHRYGWMNGWFAGIGDARSDTPDLYELLIDPADADGVPDLDAFDARVWASISESEGCLNALNTYDTAFVSVGPIQQTAGARNYKGELQGALDTARRTAPEAYQRHLGRYGLEVVRPAMELGARKAHFKLHGEVLDDAESKHVLRDFAWAHRLAEAFGDPALREPMLREGFGRLRRIREREVAFDVEVSGTTHTIEATLGEIFRTDLAQALLLDAHVNRPALIWSRNEEQNIWLRPTTKVFEDEAVLAPSSLTREQELQLVAMLLTARIDSGMSDPVGRAIGILKYTDNDIIEDLAQADADARGIRDERVETLLTYRLELSENDAQAEWRGIQSHDRTVLSLHS